jgi:hypothetical protein
MLRPKKVYLADWISNFPQKAWAVITKTYIEVLICGAIFAGIGVSKSYNKNVKAAQNIQIAYSDIEHTEQRLNQDGQTCSALTKVHAHGYDAPMTVLHAHNESYRRNPSAPHQEFAKILEEDTETATRGVQPFYKRLQDNVDEVEEHAPQALDELDKILRAAHDAKLVKHMFENTWEYKKKEIGHLEAHTTCDSTGCETTYEWECDYLLHHFTYHANYGERSDVQFKNFAQKHPDLDIGITLPKSTDVSPYNRRVITENTAQDSLSEVEILRLINLWNTNAIYTLNLPDIEESHAKVMHYGHEWSSAQNTAKDETLRSGCYGFSSPDEYDITEHIISNLKTLRETSGEIATGIRFAQKHLPNTRKKYPSIHKGCAQWGQ